MDSRLDDGGVAGRAYPRLRFVGSPGELERLPLVGVETESLWMGGIATDIMVLCVYIRQVVL